MDLLRPGDTHLTGRLAVTAAESCLPDAIRGGCYAPRASTPLLGRDVSNVCCVLMRTICAPAHNAPRYSFTIKRHQPKKSCGRLKGYLRDFLGLEIAKYS